MGLAHDLLGIVYPEQPEEQRILGNIQQIHR